MSRAIANPTQQAPLRGRGAAARRGRRRNVRSGLAVGLLLITLLLLATFSALTINIGRLSQVRTQLRSTCQAAALAGAAELMDEGALAGNPDQRDDVLTAREMARLYALANPVDGRAVVLHTNPNNHPLGDLVFCNVEPFGPVGQLPALPADATQPVNTIRVTARLGRNTLDRVSLWFGRVAGMATADVAAQAQATLDRRVAGFRPEASVCVPVVPLVADDAAWQPVAAGGIPTTGDLYAVNPQTGEVVAGSDGIPEITLLFGLPAGGAVAPADAGIARDGAGEPLVINVSTTQTIVDETPVAPVGRAAALALDEDDANPWIWSTRCRDGLSAADLKSRGGELVVRDRPSPIGVLPGIPADLPYTLMEIIGQNRAWPLGVASADGTTYDLVGFAAGRIVAVRPASSSNAWELVVQPSTLVSSQAVTWAATPANPWIGKLELTQ